MYAHAWAGFTSRSEGQCRVSCELGPSADVSPCAIMARTKATAAKALKVAICDVNKNALSSSCAFANLCFGWSCMTIWLQFGLQTFAVRALYKAGEDRMASHVGAFGLAFSHCASVVNPSALMREGTGSFLPLLPHFYNNCFFTKSV